MLQEVRVCNEAEAEIAEILPGGRNRFGDAPQMGRLGSIIRNSFEVSADGFQLPQEALLRLRTGGLLQQTIDQAGHHVRPKGQPGRQIPSMLPLRSSALEELGMHEDVCRRAELAEQLLGREQNQILPLQRVLGGCS